MKAYYPDNPDCYICGVPILTSIVDPSHPLFGTIDHVCAKATGGVDDAANRKPAHRFCNQTKGTGPLTPEIVSACRVAIADFIKQNQHLAGFARLRKAIGTPKKKSRFKHEFTVEMFEQQT